MAKNLFITILIVVFFTFKIFQFFVNGELVQTKDERPEEFPIEIVNSYIDNYGHYDAESPIVYLHHEETKPAANRKAHFNVCKELLKGFYFYIKLYSLKFTYKF